MSPFPPKDGQSVPRVLIAVPFAVELCHAPFAMALAALHYYEGKRGTQLGLLDQVGTGITVARRTLVDRALSLGATHVFFIDGDMTFPPNALERLLSHKVHIVGASYVRRYPPHDMLGALDPGMSSTRPDLATMFHLPLGLTLIRTEVFRSIPRDKWFDATATISEDTHFCHTASAWGFSIYMDPLLTTQTGHSGMVIHRPRSDHALYAATAPQTHEALK